MDSIAQELKSRLRAVGFDDAEIINCRETDAHFGNAEAVFRVGGLLLKVLRERGQEFLQIAPATDDSKFYEWSDVEVALEWIPLHEVVTRDHPEELDDILKRLKSNILELTELFSDDRALFTLGRLERVAAQRAAAFVDHLRSRSST